MNSHFSEVDCTPTRSVT